MKKYLGITFLIILLLFCIAWFAKYTVIAEEKSDDFGNSYGYQIEKYVFWKSTKFTIWSKRPFSYRMYSTYELPSLTIEEVVEKKWLKHNAAIYLNLKIKYHDSMVSVSPARVIYDFHRGELHTSSNLTLWRFFNDKNKGEEWMSESEFNSILQQLEQ